MKIHQTAALGFSRAGEDYERGRPDYPPAALQYLAEVLRLRPGTTVLDLAAGTGKLTRQLAATGARLIAVEPVEGMRRYLAASLPEVEPLAGTAESIPLSDGCLDAVTVAQAFHWFDGPRALGEIHRVLRTGGRLALIWNSRDGFPVWDRINEVIEPCRRGAPHRGSGRWQAAFAATRLFTPLAHRAFDHRQELTLDQAVARVASISFVAALPEAERAAVLSEVEAALEVGKDRNDSRYLLPYRTDVYWCERRGGARPR